MFIQLTLLYWLNWRSFLEWSFLFSAWFRNMFAVNSPRMCTFDWAIFLCWDLFVRVWAFVWWCSVVVLCYDLTNVFDLVSACKRDTITLARRTTNWPFKWYIAITNISFNVGNFFPVWLIKFIKINMNAIIT